MAHKIRSDAGEYLCNKVGMSLHALRCTHQSFIVQPCCMLMVAACSFKLVSSWLQYPKKLSRRDGMLLATCNDRGRRRAKYMQSQQKRRVCMRLQGSAVEKSFPEDGSFTTPEASFGCGRRRFHFDAENALMPDDPDLLWLYILRSAFKSVVPCCSMASVDIAADIDARVLAVACSRVTLASAAAAVRRTSKCNRICFGSAMTRGMFCCSTIDAGSCAPGTLLVTRPTCPSRSTRPRACPASSASSPA
jgi:hypothetical protein